MSDTAYLPIPDSENGPFWEGLAKGQFLLKWCKSCERPHYYPRDFCPLCWSEDTEWRPASGRGVVFATTVIRQYGLPPFKDRVPYNISIIELEEGPRVLTNVVGSDATEVRIGMEVELAPEVHGEIGLPLFKLKAG